MSKEKHSAEELEHFDGWKTVANVIKTFSTDGKLETNVEDVVYTLEKEKWSPELANIPKDQAQPLHEKSPGSLQGEVRGRPGGKWAWKANVDGHASNTWNGHAPTAVLGVRFVELIFDWLNESRKKELGTEHVPDEAD